MDHTIEIPERFLLVLAAYGNMGDGEVPKLLQIWAEREVNRLGLAHKLASERDLRLQVLKRRIANLFGETTIPQQTK